MQKIAATVLSSCARAPLPEPIRGQSASDQRLLVGQFARRKKIIKPSLTA
jgi:hypothetical protein